MPFLIYSSCFYKQIPLRKHSTAQTAPALREKCQLRLNAKHPTAFSWTPHISILIKCQALQVRPQWSPLSAALRPSSLKHIIWPARAPITPAAPWRMIESNSMRVMGGREKWQQMACSFESWWLRRKWQLCDRTKEGAFLFISFFFCRVGEKKKAWLADSPESPWLLPSSLLDGPPQWMGEESTWNKTRRFCLSFFFFCQSKTFFLSLILCCCCLPFHQWFHFIITPFSVSHIVSASHGRLSLS